MGAFKSINASDVITLPYIANKQWYFDNNNINQNEIYVYEGIKLTSSFDPDIDPISGNEYSRLIYNTINHYFYHNYEDYRFNTQSLQSSLNYQNISLYRPSSSYYEYGNLGGDLIKNLPTQSNSTIQVLSIPKNIIGSSIRKSSFYFSSSISFNDDSYGNLYYNSSSIGNIFYEYGIIVITHQNYQNIFDSTYRFSFKNEHIIYEKTIKCTILDREFGHSYNPTLQSGSAGTLVALATSSYFSPYITTVGLYDDYNNLLAVAKLGQPLPTTSEIDYNIIIKLDW